MWRKQSNHTRKLQKKKDKEVTNYKLFKQYNKALKSQGDGDGAGAVNMQRFSEADQVGASESNPDSGTSDVHANQDAERKRIKKKKISAFEKARREWGKKQEEQKAAREAAEVARKQREAEMAAARKRRSEHIAIFKKRTKKGQPTLGLQADVLLQRIQKMM